MRALVTGGLGFIGSHLVDRLLEDEHHVFVIDKSRSAPDRWGVRVDITRARFQDAVFYSAFDIVYHLAGPVGPVGVLLQAGRMTADILGMAERLVDARCPVVFVSTSEVYGEQAQPMDESAPRIIAAGHSARMEYATAKLAAETMLLNSGCDVRIIRPFNVAGPRQQSEGGFVLPRFLEQARRGTPLTVYQPGTQQRAFTHVFDIVDGIVRAGRDGEGVYNLGNPDNACSILELAQDVLEVTGSSSTIEVIDPVSLWGPAFHEAPDKIPDITKASRELGWEPRYSRRQTIEDAWRGE